MIVVLTDVLIKRFVKNSEQINDTAVRTSYGYLSGGVGIMVNVILCLIKLFIGFVSGSIAIIGDAIHNLADAGASVITILGYRMSAKPADPNRPIDPRAKVYDDTATAPFLAKDADKFWNADNAALCQEVCNYICEEYKGSMDAPVLEGVLETYIKGKEWPMGKVMNSLRLALTGAASGLGIAAILSFIGRAEFARRMAFVAQRLG